MRKLKLFLRRPFFAAPGPVSFLEYLPVSGDEAAALRLYENYNRSSDNITYYALQPDGDLIAWGGAPGKLYSGYFPYFMRRKIARDVTFFTCMPYAFLYVDTDHILWGNGSDPQILQSEEQRKVRIMEDVKEVAADDRYALALKTDGTVWAWPGRNTIKYNQQQGLEPSASTPVQIAENMQSIFAEDYSFFGLSKENVLVYLNPSGGKPVSIAEGAKEASLFYPPGKTIYQYLTQQGEAYTFKTRFPMKTADHVHSLCTNGLLKEDHSL